MERKKELKNDQTQNDYLENLRMNIVFKENTILFASIALGLGIFALTGQPMFLIALIAFGLTTRIISTQDKRKFYDEYKRIVVSETFREIFSNSPPHRVLSTNLRDGNWMNLFFLSSSFQINQSNNLRTTE